MKIKIKDYIEQEKEIKRQEDVEKAERDAFDSEYWYYNPHEDAGDRV